MGETASTSPVPPLRFPLGENVYAYVKTRDGCTKIHIRHFVQPTNTKGGNVVASVKGVKMDLKMLNRLCKVKKRLSEEFKNQLNNARSARLSRRQWRQKKNKNNKDSLRLKIPGFVTQRRSDLADLATVTATAAAAAAAAAATAPGAPEGTMAAAADNYPNCCFNVSALTPKYALTTEAGAGAIVYPSNCVDENSF